MKGDLPDGDPQESAPSRSEVTDFEDIMNAPYTNEISELTSVDVNSLSDIQLALFRAREVMMRRIDQLERLIISR